MIIGIDFDNTIVNYELVFHRVSVEMGLISPETQVAKAAVKAAVLEGHDNERWTMLQGEVYGPRMSDAEIYSGVEDFFDRAFQGGEELRIISHKTQYPAVGPKYDLRSSAREFIRAKAWFDKKWLAFSEENVSFHSTRADKIDKIRSLGCDWFIDDLPELLLDSAFPVSTRKILFDPKNQFSNNPAYERVGSWVEIKSMVFDGN